MSVKGQAVDFLSGIAAAAPWRSACERALVSLGHKYPSSRTISSFCRHFGSKLIDCEGSGFARVATFESGGKMFCGGEKKLAQLSLFYYFTGYDTDVHTEDEHGVVRLLGRLVRKDDIFFDLGANFGFYSCYVLPLCGTSGAVHAFEANPCLIPHLRRSVELNAQFGAIHVNGLAVGKESGKYLELYDPDRIGGSSLYPHEWLNRDSKVLVPIVTIDEYVRTNGIKRIDVMKIDIEGAELDALQGMAETLRICPPKTIVCELTLLPAEGSPHRNGPEIRRRAGSAADPFQLADFLKQKGYELCEITGDGRLRAGYSLEPTDGSALKLVNVAFIQPELKRLRPELFTSQ